MPSSSYHVLMAKVVGPVCMHRQDTSPGRPASRGPACLTMARNSRSRVGLKCNLEGWGLGWRGFQGWPEMERGLRVGWLGMGRGLGTVTGGELPLLRCCWACYGSLLCFWRCPAPGIPKWGSGVDHIHYAPRSRVGMSHCTLPAAIETAAGWHATSGFAREAIIVRVLGVLHRVLGVLHRVLRVLRRVLGVLHRVLGVLHRALGLHSNECPVCPTGIHSGIWCRHPFTQ